MHVAGQLTAKRLGHADIGRKLAPGKSIISPVGLNGLRSLRAGSEIGGIPIATPSSLISDLLVCFVREAAKSYGTRKLAAGLGAPRPFGRGRALARRPEEARAPEPRLPWCSLAALRQPPAGLGPFG
jgi:hypothetical protein